MVDIDGKFTYSKIVAIKVDGNENVLQIFPNPARDILNVQTTGINGNSILEITDITGRKVKKENITLNGTTSIPIDLNNLQKGTYILLVKGGALYEQIKFVKE